MQQHSSRDVGNRLHSAFSNTILVMGVSSTETNALFMLANMLHKRSSLECAAIRQICFDDNAMRKRHRFESMLGSNGLNSGESDLMLNVHIA